MQWIIFLLLVFAWFFFLALARENSSWIRKTLYVFFTFTLGTQLLFSGIDFPNGTVSTISGSVTTQTVNYVNYTAALSGANSQPVLWGLGWGLTLYGIFGLVLVFVEVFSEIQKYQRLGKQIVWPWDKKGV